MIVRQVSWPSIWWACASTKSTILFFKQQAPSRRRCGGRYFLSFLTGSNIISHQNVRTLTSLSCWHCQQQQLPTQQLQPSMPYPESLLVQPKWDPKSRSGWKEAASLMILARNDPSMEPADSQSSFDFDYRVLMVKRSAQSSAFGSAFVFPGGQVELADFNTKWYGLFEKSGIPKNELDNISTEIVGPRPPIVTNSITVRENQDFHSIHMDVGLRISAIRETFEEAGILLVVDPKNRLSNDYCPILTSETVNVNLSEWQKKVRSDGGQFYQLCETLKMVPNIWALYEWSNWLTPISVGHRRFDTIFYVCCFNGQPSVKVDNAEVIQPLWCSPTRILDEHQSEQVFLAPPQVYELCRLLNFTQLDRFQRYLRSRQALGTQRWLPVLCVYDDGAVSLVPGDEQYPVQPELLSGLAPVPEYTGSVEEANRNVKSMNRMELRGIRCHTLCNVEPGCGHLPPITYPFDKRPHTATMAKL